MCEQRQLVEERDESVALGRLVGGNSSASQVPLWMVTGAKRSNSAATSTVCSFLCGRVGVNLNIVGRVMANHCTRKTLDLCEPLGAECPRVVVGWPNA